jgi:hypothetical protein
MFAGHCSGSHAPVVLYLQSRLESVTEVLWSAHHGAPAQATKPGPDRFFPDLGFVTRTCDKIARKPDAAAEDWM